MASWGIMGGAAVNAYQKAEQIKRDQEWQDMQREEWKRQRDQEKAIEDVISAPPEEKPRGLPVTPEFVQQTLPGLNPAASQELSESLKNASPEQASEIVRLYQQQYSQPQGLQAPKGVAPPKAPSFRAYRGDDGQTYMSAGDDAPVRQSELILSKAQKLMSGVGGAKGVQLGMQYLQQGKEMAKQELLDDVQNAMKAPDINGKVDGLMRLINGNAYVPGTAHLAQGKDGSVVLVHSVPGKDQPFQMQIKGKTPDEIVNNLAMRAMAMVDSGFRFKLAEFQMQQQDKEADNERKDMEFGLKVAKDMFDRSNDTRRLELDERRTAASIRASDASARSAGRQDTAAQRNFEFQAKQAVEAGLFPDIATAKKVMLARQMELIPGARAPSNPNVKVGDRMSSDGMTLHRTLPDGTTQVYQKDPRTNQFKLVQTADDINAKISSALPPPGGSLFGKPAAAPARGLPARKQTSTLEQLRNAKMPH